MKLLDKLPHIGMRKVKSILAIFVGFWVWQVVRIFFPSLEVHPIFIYVYGVIEMRATSGKTVEMGKERIRATFTAMGTALPLMALQGYLKTLVQASWAHTGIELLVILVGVLITLIVAEKAECKTFCGLAAAIFSILMVAHADELYIYSVLRACQTILGVLIAWLINVKVFPYPGKTKNAAS